MNATDSNKEKQQIAMGRNRDAALRVIMKRLLGGVYHYGIPFRDSSRTTSLWVERGKFLVQLRPEPHCAYICVVYERRYSVFSARIYSDGAGNAMDRRLYVIGW